MQIPVLTQGMRWEKACTGKKPMAINQISHNITPGKVSSVFGASENGSPAPLVPRTGQPETARRSQDPGNTPDRRQPAPQTDTTPASSASGFTTAERLLLAELKKADTQVRQHEMAHVTAGAGVVTSGASFSYKRGPDGRNYAVAGEVSIDTAPVPGDPQATIRKMRQVKTAALAPASPSSQDLKVASRATAMAAKAASELMVLQARERAAANDSRAFGSSQNVSDSYTRVNTLPESDTHTFDLAV